MRFTWDPKKAAANIRKHGVTFDEACAVFDDPLALVQPDGTHVDRLLILGESSRARLLLVVYVERAEGDTVRILSARKVTAHERTAYQGR